MSRRKYLLPHKVYRLRSPTPLNHIQDRTWETKNGDTLDGADEEKMSSISSGGKGSGDNDAESPTPGRDETRSSEVDEAALAVAEIDALQTVRWSRREMHV